MRITKHGHACVRLETGTSAVVVDPGVFTDPGAVEDATAVLVTHEHPDHYHPDHLRRTDARIWTIADVAARLAQDSPDLAERVTVVAPGDHVDVGVPVTVVGEQHAVIHPELPRVHNSGYVVEADGLRAYHPGDALTAPPEPVDLLLLPVSAPWLKASEAIDFAREVGAPRNLAIHDAIYSEAGLGIVDGHLQRFLEPRGQAYERLAVGAELA